MSKTRRPKIFTDPETKEVVVEIYCSHEHQGVEAAIQYRMNIPRAEQFIDQLVDAVVSLKPKPVEPINPLKEKTLSFKESRY